MKLNESNFFFLLSQKEEKKSKRDEVGKQEKKEKFFFLSKKKELSGEQRANSRNRSTKKYVWLSTCPLYMKSNNPAM